MSLSPSLSLSSLSLLSLSTPPEPQRQNASSSGQNGLPGEVCGTHLSGGGSSGTHGVSKGCRGEPRHPEAGSSGPVGVINGLCRGEQSQKPRMTAPAARTALQGLALSAEGVGVSHVSSSSSLLTSNLSKSDQLLTTHRSPSTCNQNGPAGRGMWHTSVRGGKQRDSRREQRVSGWDDRSDFTRGCIPRVLKGHT